MRSSNKLAIPTVIVMPYVRRRLDFFVAVAAGGMTINIDSYRASGRNAKQCVAAVLHYEG
jgi:hypothetical protein